MLGYLLLGIRNRFKHTPINSDSLVGCLDDGNGYSIKHVVALIEYLRTVDLYVRQRE